MSNQYSRSNQPPYLLLTLFLILLSAAAYAGLNWLKVQPQPATTSTSPLITPSSDLPTKALATTSPTSTIQNPEPETRDLTPEIQTPTPTFRSFTSPTDNFNVTYASSRKLYQDTENDGINRYTFYRNDSNFAIHVGREVWAWEHSNRDFSGDFLVSGQNTFRFETAGQTIVDIDKNGLKYTIQCIHGNQPAVISECDNFVKSFELNL